MGLFSIEKKCRHSTMCTCGDNNQQQEASAALQPNNSSSGGASYADTPLKVEDYIDYIKKNIPGKSTAVVRELVNRHLQTNPGMSMSTMLGRVRRQLT